MNKNETNQKIINCNNHPKKIGIMDKVYFASKLELLSWVSSILDMEFTSIDHLLNCVIFYQLLDAAAHPGSDE